MKAIVQDVYGSADVLRLEDIERPPFGDDEVLVRVRAAGVEPGVWHLMTGQPWLVRLASGLRVPKVRVRGRELAGRVEAIGRAVTRFRPGDEVMGTSDGGSYAEYATAHEDHLALRPANLTPEQAAIVPVSAATALQAVRDHARVQPGQRVLVIGASGGVGTFAVQIAKAYGADVTAVCSASKVDLVRSIGADHVIDYQRKDFAASGPRFDVAVFIGGAWPLSHLRRAVTPRGTLVIVGGVGRRGVLGGMQRNFLALAIAPFVRQRLRGFVTRENAVDLGALTELIEAGRVTPVLDRTYPLAEAPDAIRYFESGRARGKVAVIVTAG